MTTLRRYPTQLTFAVHVLVVFLAVAFHWKHDNWLSDYDRATQFLPWFSYLGDRLRDFDSPGWYIHDSSGYSFVGAPASGWMYFPIMLAFTLFDAETGYKAFILFKVLIGGLSTFALCRRLGMGNLATFAASTLFAIGPLLYGATMFNTPVSQTLAFFPLGLLAAENALRSSRLSGQLSWSMVGAIALLNMFTGSPPRFMFGALMIAGWLGYRWLLSTPPEVASKAIVLKRALVFGLSAGIGMVTLGLAAIWPLIEFQAASNVAGGDYSSLVGGDYVERLPSWRYIAKTYLEGNNLTLRLLIQGSVVWVLAGAAFLLGRNRHEAWFFAGLLLVFLDLTWRHSLTRPVLNLIPGFEQINSHRPSSSSGFVAFAAAMLIGAGISMILQNPRGRWVSLVKLVPVGILIFLFDSITKAGYDPGWWQISLAVVGTALLFLPEIAHILKRDRFSEIAPHLAAVSLIVLLLIYPFGIDVARTLNDPEARPEWLNPFALDPIVEQTMDTILATDPIDQPASAIADQYNVQHLFRYAPYTGTANPLSGYNPAASRRMEPEIVAMMANSRATFLGLEQISGYNPVHYKHYVDYIEVMNGAEQDYHYLDVMEPAIAGSQLLDMLNVKYVIVPRRIEAQPYISQFGRIFYADDLVIVYENPAVFPRAWIVHNVEPTMDGAELELFNSNQVDGRQTAFVYGELPSAFEPPESANADIVTFIKHEPEYISVQATNGGDGLLVFSEVYDKGWKAYVDGNEVDLLRTNHALRGVPLSAGEHNVELKYEPIELTIGLWSTGISGVMMLAIWIWAGIERFRSRLFWVTEIGAWCRDQYTDRRHLLRRTRAHDEQIERASIEHRVTG